MSMKTRTLFRISTLTLALAAFVCFSSCSDDEEPAFQPTLPTNGGNPVKAIIRTGDIAAPTYDWQFYYEGPRLIDAKGTIRDADDTIDKTFSYQTSLTYGDHKVYVKNSTGKKIQITLNGSNYIEKMLIGRNIYEFQYKNGYLCSWQKTIFENEMSATQYTTFATIEYTENGNNFDYKKINYTGPDNVTITTTFIPHNLKNTNGLLPEAASKEIGCLDFEYLYYAGLLGKGTTHLVKSLSLNNPSDSTKNYTLNFIYDKNSVSNNTTLCTYQTPSGTPVSVNYAY